MGLVFSVFFGFLLSFLGAVLSMHLAAESAWAQANGHWLMPALWTGVAVSLIGTALSVRRLKGGRTIHQSTYGVASPAIVATHGGTVTVGSSPIPSRPKVIALHCGYFNETREALYVTNDGDTAVDVCVDSTNVGEYVVTFDGPVSLKKGPGHIFIDCIRKTLNGGVIAPSLDAAWIEAYSSTKIIPNIRLHIAYKDADRKQSHGRTFSLQRDVVAEAKFRFRAVDISDDSLNDL